MRFNVEDILELETMLRASRHAVIVTHAKPDGDALGSSFALKTYLESLKDGFRRQAEVLLVNRPAPTLEFIIAGSPFHVADDGGYGQILRDADLLVCLDCSGLMRTESLAPALEALECPKILIDHHIGPHTEEFDLVISRTDVSSASELLYWLLKSFSDIAGNAAEIPEHSRMALMAGMTTDTNNFANSVFPSTLEMASELLATGIDRDYIIEKIYNEYRENRLRLIGHLLGKVMKISAEGVAYTLLDEKTMKHFDMQEGELEGFVNMPLTIAKVKMSVFIRQDGDIYRVSVRSKKGVSANKFARLYFNGGGHEQAAGGRLLDVKGLDELEKYLLSGIADFFA